MKKIRYVTKKEAKKLWNDKYFERVTSPVAFPKHLLKDLPENCIGRLSDELIVLK